MRAVGLRAGEIVDVPLSISDRNDWRAWLTAPPSPAEWRWTNRDPIAADVYRNLNLMAAKLMFNASRTGELVATYDTAVGLFGLGPGRPVRIDQIHEIPIVALALRAKGRGAEADRLLAEGETMARAVHRRGVTPFLFDADVAALLAVQGRRVEALTMLELAFRRGWRQNGSADLVDLSDEPAFRSLAGEPRFARLRALLVAHYERERREMSQLRL